MSEENTPPGGATPPPAMDAPSPVPATPAPVTDLTTQVDMTPEQEDAIDAAERARMQGKEPVAVPAPATPAPTPTPSPAPVVPVPVLDASGVPVQVRNPDGTFGPKIADHNKSAAPVPAAAVVKPTPAKVAEPVVFDAGKTVEDVIASLADREYITDASTGAKQKLSELMDQYGQILEPVRDMLGAVVASMEKRRVEDRSAIVAEVRQSFERESEQASAAVAATKALVDAGVSDASAIIEDPRMDAFLTANPELAGLLSVATTPKAVKNNRYVLDQFREAHGIANPTPGQPSPVPSPRSALSALSSIRGQGQQGQPVVGMTESEEDRIDREERARVRQEQGRK